MILSTARMMTSHVTEICTRRAETCMPAARYAFSPSDHYQDSHKRAKTIIKLSADPLSPRSTARREAKFAKTAMILAHTR